jgi:RNA recognition motif-containing protein
VARLEASLFTAAIPTQEQAEKLTPIGASTTENKTPKIFRTVAGDVWDDPSMADWNPNDFRLFVGNIGNEVTDITLRETFSVYPTFDRARVVRDKSGKTKGFGFVSFLEAKDFLRAMKEWNGQYIGNRPCMLKRSTWDERSVKNPKKVQRAPGQLKHAKK